MSRTLVIGDICDRGPEADLSIDRLLALDHVLLVRGNHDDWALDWMRNGWVDPAWLTSGGMETLDAYARRAGLAHLDDLEQAAALAAEVPPEHMAFLEAGADLHTESLSDGRRASPRGSPRVRGRAQPRNRAGCLQGIGLG